MTFREGFLKITFGVRAAGSPEPKGVCLCVCMCVYVHICMCVYLCGYVCMNVCVCVYRCVYVCIPASVYVYLCVYVYMWFACMWGVCVCVCGPLKIFSGQLLFFRSQLNGHFLKEDLPDHLIWACCFHSPVSLHLALTTICDCFIYFLVLLLSCCRRPAWRQGLCQSYSLLNS